MSNINTVSIAHNIWTGNGKAYRADTLFPEVFEAPETAGGLTLPDLVSQALAEFLPEDWEIGRPEITRRPHIGKRMTVTGGKWVGVEAPVNAHQDDAHTNVDFDRVMWRCPVYHPNGSSMYFGIITASEPAVTYYGRKHIDDMVDLTDEITANPKRFAGEW